MSDQRPLSLSEFLLLALLCVLPAAVCSATAPQQGAFAVVSAAGWWLSGLGFAAVVAYRALRAR